MNLSACELTDRLCLLGSSETMSLDSKEPVSFESEERRNSGLGPILYSLNPVLALSSSLSLICLSLANHHHHHLMVSVNGTLISAHCRITRSALCPPFFAFPSCLILFSLHAPLKEVSAKTFLFLFSVELHSHRERKDQPLLFPLQPYHFGLDALLTSYASVFPVTPLTSLTRLINDITFDASFVNSSSNFSGN